MPPLRGSILAFAALSLSLFSNKLASAQLLNATNIATCQQIANAISGASQVFYSPSPGYIAGVKHWASSSSEVATCVVEPGTAADVGVILQIVGQRQTPFAVKGGGHASNPNFSSTTGVQIAMSRFNNVTYSASSQTASIGAGLVWDDVYAALETFNVSVVGGRVSGVGVAGFTLGGGYSWKSSQYGLTVDTVVSYELVMPNGTVTEVTAANADLFFALKGGFNNFGIVTKFVLRTFPQTQVFGGFMLFPATKYPEILNATERFTNGAGATDPKAAMLINLAAATVAPLATVIMFYDAPTAPPGTFDDFLNIPGATFSDVKTRSLLSLVQATPGSPEGLRGAFETVSTTGYNMAMLQAVANETTSLLSNLGSTLGTGLLLNYALEPFHPDVFTHNTLSNGAGGPSAYPPTRAQALFPLNLYFSWVLPLFDVPMQNAITTSAKSLEQVASNLGLLPPGGTSETWLYGNYAITGTPLARIYGGNLQRLATIRANVDPGNVMGLAGGWKV